MTNEYLENLPAREDLAVKISPADGPNADTIGKLLQVGMAYFQRQLLTRDEAMEHFERRPVCRTHDDLVVWTTALMPYCRQWNGKESGECLIEEVWIECTQQVAGSGAGT